MKKPRRSRRRKKKRRDGYEINKTEKLSNGTVKRIRIQKIKEWTRFGFESEIRWRWGDITVTVRRVHFRVLLTAPLLTPNPDYIIITSGGTKQATNALAACQRVDFFFSADRDAKRRGLHSLHRNRLPDLAVAS